MGQSDVRGGELSVEVRNLGGIDHSTVDLRTGVNILAGRNATNRTSFLRALMGALGSDNVSLKADAEVGDVTLQTPTDTYSRRLERQNGSVVDSGTPYLDDPTIADLFAFLLESNEARRAVSRGENLRELIMRPVDVEAIQAEIDAAVAKKRQLDNRIEELKQHEAERTQIEAELGDIETEIEEIKAELRAKRETLSEMDGSVEATKTQQEAIEQTVEELQSVHSELEETRFQKETEQESLETLHSERKEIVAELDSLPETSVDERDRIERQLDEHRTRRSELDAATSQLQSVIQFNEEMLEGTNPVIANALRDAVDSAESADPTDQLTESEQVICWTCGSEVETDDINTTLERLKTVRQQRLTERRELREDIDTLAEQYQQFDVTNRKQTQLKDRLDRTDDEIETRSERIDSHSEELASLRDTAEALKTELEAHEQSTDSSLLEIHTEINQLEFELSRKEATRQQLVDQRQQIDQREAERRTAETERSELTDRLTQLRTQIDQLEAEAIEAFNEHMDAVLATLGYDNLARIWIERSTETVREGRQTVDKSVFRLHIVRQTDDGQTYEDTIDHLSESEREVTGLVFALAGYLVHDLNEVVPVMILDSLEAIDSDRIANLVEYFSEYVETIVVALLPEDAQALDDSYHRVTDV